MKKYSTVLGIDISKMELDLCLLNDNGNESFKIENNSTGFRQLLEIISQVSKNELLVCLEHTGIYSFPLCQFLSKNGINYTLVPAAQIKKSLGIQRGKSDKADAKSIARYGFLFQNEIQLTALPEKLIMKLKLLFSHRERLVKAKTTISMPSKELNGFLDPTMITTIQNSSKRLCESIKKQIEQIDKKMLTLIQSNLSLSKSFNLCQSIPGIGPQIAIYLIITTKDFKSFNSARQFACYSGIAPFEYSSGSSIKGRTRVSHLANKKAKSLLSMGALNAIRHDREIRAYYERKVSEGKNKMAVINAVKNKLIARVFATINRGIFV